MRKMKGYILKPLHILFRLTEYNIHMKKNKVILEILNVQHGQWGNTMN